MPRHAALPFRHPRTWVRLTGVVTALVLLVTATVVATTAKRLESNMSAHDVADLMPDVRPELEVPEDGRAGQPLNILVMGSDSRDGANRKLDRADVSGARADVTIVAHISADRSRVDLVSVPRDTRVDIPSCKTSTGVRTPAASSRFNAAFAWGAAYGKDIKSAATCTMTLVESLTDLRLDGFVVLDFAGFEAAVDAVGGVKMRIPEDLKSRKAGLSLKAGTRQLDGRQALAYARARTFEKGTSDGSDLSRIDRQQELIHALAAAASDKLADLPALYGFLDATTKALDVSKNLASVKDLAGLAVSVRDAKVTTITAPTVTNPANRNEVIFTQDAAAVWKALKKDRPLPS